MSVLLDRNTRVLVQGMTGRIGSFHAAEMISIGTQVVGGVTPGKGGTKHLGVPVFDSVHQAVAATGATASIVFVPPAGAGDSIMEGVDAGLELVVSITDGIPTQDMVAVKALVRKQQDGKRTRVVGPNCAGIITPGEAMMGIMPPHIYSPGRVGIVSRSGTLGYEAASQLRALGLGVSTSVGIGGDPVNGTAFVEILALFEADPKTDAVVMIGEIGGPQEVEGAAYIRDHMKKPVVAYIAGLSAPRGRRMGHAGAVVTGPGESAAEKVEALKAAGVAVAPTPSDIGSTVARVLGQAA